MLLRLLKGDFTLLFISLSLYFYFYIILTIAKVLFINSF
jgi:hypothetical protein